MCVSSRVALLCCKRAFVSHYSVYITMSTDDINSGKSLEEKDVVRERKCSKCGQPCRGHRGPYGSECRVDQDAEAGAEKGPENAGIGEDALTKLVDQLSLMNTNLTAIHSGQDELKAILARTHSSGTSPPVIQHTTSGNSTANEISSIALPNGNRISDKAIHSAKRGEFVNMSDFLPIADMWKVSEIEPTLDHNGIFSFHQKRPSRTIDNFNQWLEAWNNFEYILMSDNPRCYNDLAIYRNFIQACDKKFSWQSVSMYDSRFRAKLVSCRDLTYAHIDSDLYTSLFDITAAKKGAKACFRCKSVEHVVQACPFPAQDPVETYQKKAQIPRFNKANKYHAGKEICHNFQVGRCHYDQCKRAHVCESCRGDQPRFRCGCNDQSQAHS